VPSLKETQVETTQRAVGLRNPHAMRSAYTLVNRVMLQYLLAACSAVFGAFCISSVTCILLYAISETMLKKFDACACRCDTINVSFSDERCGNCISVLVRARMIESQTSVRLNLLAEKQTATTLHPFNGVIFRTTWVSRYQKGKTSLDLNEARDDGIWG